MEKNMEKNCLDWVDEIFKIQEIKWGTNENNYLNFIGTNKGLFRVFFKNSLGGIWSNYVIDSNPIRYCNFPDYWKTEVIKKNFFVFISDKSKNAIISNVASNGVFNGILSGTLYKAWEENEENATFMFVENEEELCRGIVFNKHNLTNINVEKIDTCSYYFNQTK